MTSMMCSRRRPIAAPLVGRLPDFLGALRRQFAFGGAQRKAHLYVRHRRCERVGMETIIVRHFPLKCRRRSFA